MSLGKRIREIRKAKGWSQDKLAIKCNFMNHGQLRISNYETDYRSPRTESLKIIAKVLRVSASWLLFGDENK
jgi:transcriptional regulator with XRE-family HTH domain